MKGKEGIFLSIILVLFLGVPSAMAQSPHFVYADATVDSLGDLVVSWKEAGLGKNVSIHYTAGATNADGWYACINGGGKHPQASNKESFSQQVYATGEFSSGKNGSITASMTVEAPAPTLVCPNGQRLVLACVTYSGISLNDDTTPLPADTIPDSVSKIFVSLPECQ